jgi:hypothetical protein
MATLQFQMKNKMKQKRFRWSMCWTKDYFRPAHGLSIEIVKLP